MNATSSIKYSRAKDNKKNDLDYRNIYDFIRFLLYCLFQD